MRYYYNRASKSWVYDGEIIPDEPTQKCKDTIANPEFRKLYFIKFKSTGFMRYHSDYFYVAISDLKLVLKTGEIYGYRRTQFCTEHSIFNVKDMANQKDIKRISEQIEYTLTFMEAMSGKSFSEDTQEIIKTRKAKNYEKLTDEQKLYYELNK